MPLRLASLFILAVVLLAQVPIGLGPGATTLSIGLLDVFNWHAATASGCTDSGPRMCVGSTNVLQGDTIYANAWFANASLLPLTTGLPIVGTLNDAKTSTCSVGQNIIVVQLAAFSWSTRNASSFYDLNCMSSYGGGASTNAPAGWVGHCTSGDDGTQGCTWKSRTPFVRGGVLYLPLERQISSGATSIHDALIAKSTDGGQTWRNPYTVAHAGAAVANGDAPPCGAAGSGVGQSCTDATYPGSMMWTSLPVQASNWSAIQYMQDGATPPSGIIDGCDPSIYTCLFLGEQDGSIARVLNTDLPSLDVTKYQYYTCPTITDVYRCPGSLSSSWTSTFASRTSGLIMRMPGGPADWYTYPNAIFGMAYIKEFYSYLAVGYQNRGAPTLAAPIYMWAPAPYGPWTMGASGPPTDYSSTPTTSLFPGFYSPSLALPYTVVSSNPPHIQMTMVADTGYANPSTTPFFTQVDLLPGKAAIYQGVNARIENRNQYSTQAGFVFSDGHEYGTFPRSPVVAAYDLYDHGGDANVLALSGFHDMLDGSSYMMGCPNNSQCGFFNPGQGLTLTSFGATLADGFSARFYTTLNERTGTARTFPAMAGNGSYSMVGVYRLNGSNFDDVPWWWTGDNSGTNTAVALQVSTATGKLLLGWGGPTQFHYQYVSNFTPSASNWIFVAVTVTANGSSPTSHMYVGVSGNLVDEIAGVSRTTTGGSPTPTPAVVAAAVQFGLDPGRTTTANVSLGPQFVASRPLTYPEIQLMYRSLKLKMLKRGVSVQ